MAETASAATSDGVKPDDSEENNIMVSVSRDGDLAQKITCSNKTVVTLYGGSKEHPIYLGKVSISRNSRRYHVNFNSDRRMFTPRSDDDQGDGEGEGR